MSKPTKISLQRFPGQHFLQVGMMQTTHRWERGGLTGAVARHGHYAAARSDVVRVSNMDTQMVVLRGGKYKASERAGFKFN